MAVKIARQPKKIALLGAPTSVAALTKGHEAGPSALKPKIEQAAKSRTLALILAGDCSVALSTVAAARRYHRNVGLVYMDRDADLHAPGTTVSGSVDGIVVSHLTGRGAAELVRLWGTSPCSRARFGPLGSGSSRPGGAGSAQSIAAPLLRGR